MNTTKAALGSLETADLREAWNHEAHDFTPWLAENLDRLGSELGIELENEATEMHVGPPIARISWPAPAWTTVGCS